MTELVDESKKSDQPRNAVIAITAFTVLALILLIVAFLVARSESLPDAVRNVGSSGAQTAGQSVAPVQSASDLDTVTVELDAADLDALDTELNQLDTDSSAF